MASPTFVSSIALSSLLAGLAVLTTGQTASAELPKKVIAAFKGQIVVSSEPIAASSDEKEAVAVIKKARRAEVAGARDGEVTAWRFHYTAFLAKAPSMTLKLKFFTNDAQALYVADKGLAGVDPKTSVLEGTLSISEDEGLTAGKSYVVKLVNESGAVLAQTPLMMK